MKVTLTEDATRALQDLQEKLRAKDPHVGHNGSAAVSQIVAWFSREATAEQLDEIAGSLLSPRARNQALLKQLMALSRGADASLAQKVLEKSIRKLNTPTPPFSENLAENA